MLRVGVAAMVLPGAGSPLLSITSILIAGAMLSAILQDTDLKSHG